MWQIMINHVLYKNTVLKNVIILRIHFVLNPLFTVYVCMLEV